MKKLNNCNFLFFSYFFFCSKVEESYSSKEDDKEEEYYDKYPLDKIPEMISHPLRPSIEMNSKPKHRYD